MNLTRWDDWYAEVDRASALLRERCDEVFVMGLSMGGTLALRLAEERPRRHRGARPGQPGLLHTSARTSTTCCRSLKLVVPSLSGIAQRHQEARQDELAYDRLPLKALAYALERLEA